MSNSLESLYIYNLGRISETEDKILLYAPLSCNCVVVDYNDLKKLETAASGMVVEKEYIDALNILATRNPISAIRNVEDFVNLSILPTNTCNFSCSYCYSAKGRSSRTIDYATVKNIIKWFVRLNRVNMPPLYITFFGGGEPILCWDSILRPAIELIKGMRKEYHSAIYVNLITNGSILPPDFISICRDSDIRVAVSFEILEELQNLHRRNFDKVLENIHTMCNNGIIPSINSVITEGSVELMALMVETAIQTIPKVKILSFEPSTGDHDNNYYDLFFNNFFLAKQLADAKGIILTTSALRNADVTVERYCAGELALTASGDLTACPCLSEPNQFGYNRWIYGFADKDNVKIDLEKLRIILARDVNANQWCDHCFARFNCGGGCLNNIINRNGKPDYNYCYFFKKFLRKILIHRMS